VKLKAITVWQPYASLLVLGLKRFETRGWVTTYRGPLVIHAAKRCDRAVVSEIERVRLLMAEFDIDAEACRNRFGMSDAQFRLTSIPWSSDLLYGRALGVVELTDCRQMNDGGSELENEVGCFGRGRHGWQCDNPIAFLQPIEDIGKQGLWRPSVEVEAEVRTELSVLA